MKTHDRRVSRVSFIRLRRAIRLVACSAVTLWLLVSTPDALRPPTTPRSSARAATVTGLVPNPYPAPQGSVAAGFDFLLTDPSTTSVTFKGDLLLPAGFFGQGSKKFKGTIGFIGNPIGSFMGRAIGPTDTIVERLQTASLPSLGSTATIPIKLRVLSLAGAEPIKVKVSGEPQLWDVRVELSPVSQPEGMMTIRKTQANGGTFDSTLPVRPHFIFTRRDGTGMTTLDPPIIEFKGSAVPWSHTPPPDALLLPGFNADFFPGVTENSRGSFLYDSKRMDLGVRLARALAQGEVPPGAGVRIMQVDFTWPGATMLNSSTGQVDVDIATLRSRTGIPEGFLNIFTNLGWVVQNLPIFADFPYPMLSTKFQLGTSNGTDIPVVEMFTLHVTTPLTDRPGTIGPMTPFPVLDVQYNSQGKGPAVVAGENPPPPTPGTVRFTVGGAIDECGQNGHTNVEAATNQCGPAAAANSLQWLEDTYRLNVPHPHQPGQNGDGSLVGELDREMGRTPGNGVSDEKFLDGKLGYLADNNLGNRVTVKHQDDGAGGSLPGGGNFTRHGLTSAGGGKPTTAFMLQEICNGEDVEVGFTRKSGSGHWVTAVKGATILGIPYLYYVSDHVQADNTQGTNMVDGSPMIDSDGDGLPNLVAEAGMPNIDIVVAESPKNIEVDRFPSSVALVTVQMPQPVQLQLSGPTTINVAIAQDGTGAADTDGDGLDQVQAEMVELTLTGSSPLGPVTVRLRDPSKHPNQRSTGEIEERTNTQAGRLDLPPFSSTPAAADSFFDVFFEVELGTPTGGQVLHSHIPKRMRSTITHKPPAQGETYFNPDVIPLFTENEQPAGVSISGASHTPNPRPQIPPIPAGTDSFPSTMVIDLREDFLPGSPTETLRLSSVGLPDTVVQRQRQAGDTIDTELVSMTLQGTSPVVGQVILRAGRNLGQLPSPGRYTSVMQRPDGSFESADSFFDITYRIDFANIPRIGPMSATGNTRVMATGIRSLPPNMNPTDPCVMFMGAGGELMPATTQIIGFVNQMTWTPFGGVPGTACSGAAVSVVRINRDVALTTSRRRDRRR